MTPTPQPPKRRRDFGDSERGATMVEFGLVGVLLFTLIFGIIEGGFAVRAVNTINNATDDAARRGAVAGTSPTADFQIMQQLDGRGAFDAATVEYVVVYNARNGSDNINSINASCKAGSPVSGVCNVYYPSSFGAGAGAFTCPAADASAWCPETRGTGGELGFLGVFVKAKYEPVVEQLMVEFRFDVDADSLQVIQTSGEL